jgi:hypothetical protein
LSLPQAANPIINAPAIASAAIILILRTVRTTPADHFIKIDESADISAPPPGANPGASWRL